MAPWHDCPFSNSRSPVEPKYCRLAQLTSSNRVNQYIGGDEQSSIISTFTASGAIEAGIDR